jgi:hypothetical protein
MTRKTFEQSLLDPATLYWRTLLHHSVAATDRAHIPEQGQEIDESDLLNLESLHREIERTHPGSLALAETIDPWVSADKF